MMRGGSIVDATLISAPSSTKNAKKERDPEMHQTKKGNQWHFGMKCHTGVDAGSGFVHTVEVTAANVHDITVAAKLLRGKMTRWSMETVLTLVSKNGKRSKTTRNFLLSSTALTVGRADCPEFQTMPSIGNAILSTRNPLCAVKVEHPYRIVKNIFGFRKTVYRGLSKNLNRLYVLFASANLYMLVRAGGTLPSA